VAEGVRGVASLGVVRIVDVIGEQRRVAVVLAVKGTGVGVHQQLVGVAAVAVGGIVGAVDAVAVPLAWLNAGEVGVPDVGIYLGKFNSGFCVVAVEQAQFYFVCNVAEEREIGACAVIGRTERVRLAGPDFHRRLINFTHNGPVYRQFFPTVS